MDNLTQQLRETVKKLFAENRVDLIIGFEKGSLPLRAAPCFIRSADEVDRLIWDASCENNLAAYIPKKKERIGIIVKGCDSRSVVGLIKERQLRRDRIVIIGIPCSGMIDRGITNEKLAGREVLAA
jgi:coenzyme F420-reducing hydrogenase beta subunit